MKLRRSIQTNLPRARNNGSCWQRNRERERERERRAEEFNLPFLFLPYFPRLFFVRTSTTAILFLSAASSRNCLHNNTQSTKFEQFMMFASLFRGESFPFFLSVSFYLWKVARVPRYFVEKEITLFKSGNYFSFSVFFFFFRSLILLRWVTTHKEFFSFEARSRIFFFSVNSRNRCNYRNFRKDYKNYSNIISRKGCKSWKTLRFKQL